MILFDRNKSINQILFDPLTLNFDQRIRKRSRVRLGILGK